MKAAYSDEDAGQSQRRVARSSELFSVLGIEAAFWYVSVSSGELNFILSYKYKCLPSRPRAATMRPAT